MQFRRLFNPIKSEREKLLAKLLRQALHVQFKNLKWYLIALRHKSAARNIHNQPDSSNERLEFLGDAVLDAAVADYLFNKYTTSEEGELTKMKSRIVSRRNLNQMAVRMQIGDLLETDLQANQARDTLAGNALEAIFGAMYLDLGYPKTQSTMLKLLKRYTNLDKIEYEESDFKSRLYEEAHRQRILLTFKTEPQFDEGSKAFFISRAFLDDKLIGEGKGISKKKAEQRASEAGCRKLNVGVA